MVAALTLSKKIWVPGWSNFSIRSFNIVSFTEGLGRGGGVVGAILAGMIVVSVESD